MKSSLSTFVYFRYPLVEAIRRTAHYGFDGVEIWGGRPHAYCDDMDSSAIKEINSVIEECGIAISNFIPAQFRYPTNLAAPDEKMRKGSVDYIRKSIDVAAQMNSPFVSLCPGFSLYGQTYHEAWDTMIKSFSELCDHAKDMPLELILEPGNRMETDLVITVDDGLRAIGEIDKRMGILIDTGHCFVNREPLSDIIEQVAGYTVHYHIDDNMGVTDDHLVMGEGKMDYTVFLDKLKGSGYSGFLAVELGFSYTVDPDPAVRKSARFFEDYVNESEGVII
jgi:protein FrlC